MNLHWHGALSFRILFIIFLLQSRVVPQDCSSADPSAVWRWGTNIYESSRHIPSSSYIVLVNVLWCARSSVCMSSVTNASFPVGTMPADCQINLTQKSIISSPTLLLSHCNKPKSQQMCSFSADPCAARSCRDQWRFGHIAGTMPGKPFNAFKALIVRHDDIRKLSFL